MKYDGLDDVPSPWAAPASRSSTVVERQQETNSADPMIAGSHDGLDGGRRRSQAGDVNSGSSDGRAGDTVDHGGIGTWQPASSGHQVGHTTSAPSRQADLEHVRRRSTDVHPQGRTRQKYSPAGHGSGDGP
jgi:hypothetical protein